VAIPRARRRAITLSVLGVLSAYSLYQAGGVVSGVEGLAGGVLKPFTWTDNMIAQPIGHMFAGMVNYSDVVTQNQQLRAALGQARMQQDVNAAAAQTLAQLEAQLHLPFIGTTPTVVAQVVNVSPTNFAATVTISKGSSSGLLAGMPVVANGGLVGTIISTTANASTVRLITDPNSNIGVTFGPQHVTALVTGQGVNDGLMVSNIPVTNPLSIGETLVSSGQAGGVVPPGIPVARVTSLSVSPGSSTYSATVAPLADLSHIAYVDVLLWEPAA